MHRSSVTLVSSLGSCGTLASSLDRSECRFSYMELESAPGEGRLRGQGPSHTARGSGNGNISLEGDLYLSVYIPLEPAIHFQEFILLKCSWVFILLKCSWVFILLKCSWVFILLKCSWVFILLKCSMVCKCGQKVVLCSTVCGVKQPAINKMVEHS